MTTLFILTGITAVLGTLALVRVRSTQKSVTELTRLTYEENEQLARIIRNHAEDARRVEDDLDGRVRQLESLPHELKTMREEIRQLSLTAKGQAECGKCRRIVPITTMNGAHCARCATGAA